MRLVCKWNSTSLNYILIVDYLPNDLGYQEKASGFLEVLDFSISFDTKRLT
jgi:hypothetical protein